jgi:hypothetical protein
VKNLYFFLLVLLLMPSIIKAQDTINLIGDHELYLVIQKNGDTILTSNIKEVVIYPKPRFSSKRDQRRYDRLYRNVLKVYPYAKMAGREYRIISAHLLTLKTEKERKVYIDQVEKEIKDKYENDLKDLTITQGRILLKLIDRETGETSYDILKDYKNSFSAIFWQALARIFGHNLKSEFEPEGEDKLINEILLQIESGKI